MHRLFTTPLGERTTDLFCVALPLPLSPGRFYDTYQSYDYTYMSCGIILIISSVFLFGGMGLNYRLLDKERKEEEKREREEPKEECTAMLEAPSPSKEEEEEEEEKEKKKKDGGAEGENGQATIAMANVSKMDEDTVL